MIACTYEIAGSDYDRAGAASRSIKKHLKQLGIAPEVVRRMVIAAYEAEMNVVIHACRGQMTVRIEENFVDVLVEDEGPGIEDVGQAMQEGFSTAPAEARALGFGAGMGLPNIKRHSDDFEIESTPGQGTRVRFTLFSKQHLVRPFVRRSVHVRPGRCQDCHRCLLACPTAAVRVYNRAPEILGHLCIDCATCIGVCPTHVFTLDAGGDLPKSADAPLLLPTVFFTQFGARVAPSLVRDALADMGFSDIWVSASWERVLREAVIEYSAGKSVPRPVISPACPAVVNLIEARFPSLIDHLAPFMSPLEAMASTASGSAFTAVAICPSFNSAIEGMDAADVIEPAALFSPIRDLVVAMQSSGETLACELPLARPAHAGVEVSGDENVMQLLDRIEDGLLADVPLVEPYLCDQGCFGSPLLVESAAVARHRWRRAAIELGPPGRAVKRARPYAPRRGIRLDEDMAKALDKLRHIDELAKRLPGHDCMECGAPSCVALAQDMVLGQSGRAACSRKRSEGRRLPAFGV